MSLDTRSNSALFKRSEQLKRWEESDTNRESIVPNQKTRKIKFSLGCVFLAACAAGDKEEVLQLIQKGADIDTANVDGLTALHQACIDDNLEMVEFLVEHGADINRGDNEGWTPLHATASCGLVSIAKYLIDNGANVAAVNNDGELPLDIAQKDDMLKMLEQDISSRGIDCDEARNEEERMMLYDAQEWLKKGEIDCKPHPKTGASALHVAAAKGYITVMNMLIQGGCDINIQDYDGWTPLHAAAHWGQKEACEMLVENFCDMDLQNYVGQTSFDVADTETFRLLEELKKKQATLEMDRAEINALHQRKSSSPGKRRSSITRMSVADKSNLVNKDVSSERQTLDRTISEEEGLDKIKKVELEIETESEKEDSSVISDNEVEMKNRVNRNETPRISYPSDNNKSVPNSITAPPVENSAENESDWKRPTSLRMYAKDETVTPRISEEHPVPKASTPTGTPKRIVDSPEVVLRRTQSFESDERFYRRYAELRARINAGSCPTLLSSLDSSSSFPTRSASLREKQIARRNQRNESEKEQVTKQVTATATTTTITTTTAVPTMITVTSSVKNQPNSPTTTTPVPLNHVRRSFVPPVRDEESETQRKAHAKRVRETRRSTQGVTLDEIKSAEQLVKKNQVGNQATNPSTTSESPLVTATITTATPTITSGTSTTSNAKDEEVSPHERRPSWRLRVDNGSKFLLEDARNRSSAPLLDAQVPYVRRLSGNLTQHRPTTALDNSSDSVVTLALRKQAKPPDDKEQDKENDSRTAQATQAVIQRRKRPKRRSTGVVHVDMDELDPDKQDSRLNSEEGKLQNEESGGGDWSARSESPAKDTTASYQSARKSKTESTTENGEIDYKKLYEEAIEENDVLREKLKKTEDELSKSKSQVDKSSVPLKNSLTEMEKRERRAMERKLSEMEEELKLLEQFKMENLRLKEENGALIRVVSKLSK